MTHRSLRYRLSGAVVVLVVLLGGCASDPKAAPATGDDTVPSVAASGSDAPAPASSSPTETSLPSDVDLKSFFDALSTGDIDDLKAAATLAEKGSVAYGMADYTLQLSNANLDGGVYETEPATTVEGTGFKSCSDPADESTCVIWDDVEGRDGKIVSFTISGDSIKKHLTVGNGQPVQAGNLGSIEFLSAYKTVISKTLVVVCRVKSGASPIVVSSYEAKYRSPQGRQSTASESYGPNEISANSTSNFTLYFPQADPGGTVSIDVYSEDFVTTETVDLRTK